MFMENLYCLQCCVELQFKAPRRLLHKLNTNVCNTQFMQISIYNNLAIVKRGSSVSKILGSQIQEYITIYKRFIFVKEPKLWLYSHRCSLVHSNEVETSGKSKDQNKSKRQIREKGKEKEGRKLTLPECSPGARSWATHWSKCYL